MSKKIERVNTVRPVKKVRKNPLRKQVDDLTDEVDELTRQSSQLEQAYGLTVSNLKLRIDWYNLLPWYVKIWEAVRGKDI